MSDDLKHWEGKSYLGYPIVLTEGTFGPGGLRPAEPIVCYPLGAVPTLGGHELVANDDLPPGEALLVDDHYLHVPSAALRAAILGDMKPMAALAVRTFTRGKGG